MSPNKSENHIERILHPKGRTVRVGSSVLKIFISPWGEIIEIVAELGSGMRGLLSQPTKIGDKSTGGLRIERGSPVDLLENTVKWVLGDDSHTNETDSLFLLYCDQPDKLVMRDDQEDYRIGYSHETLFAPAFAGAVNPAEFEVTSTKEEFLV